MDSATKIQSVFCPLKVYLDFVVRLLIGFLGFGCVIEELTAAGEQIDTPIFIKANNFMPWFYLLYCSTEVI